jgi:hypothetical protein
MHRFRKKFTQLRKTVIFVQQRFRHKLHNRHLAATKPTSPQVIRLEQQPLDISPDTDPHEQPGNVHQVAPKRDGSLDTFTPTQSHTFTNTIRLRNRMASRGTNNPAIKPCQLAKLTESQLLRLTALNTKHNSGYKRTIQVHTISKDFKRPPSPSSRLKNKASSFARMYMRNFGESVDTFDPAQIPDNTRVTWNSNLCAPAVGPFSPKNSQPRKSILNSSLVWLLTLSIDMCIHKSL